MPKTIFIVENEPELLDSYVESLRLSGYVIAGTARNGVQAIKKLRKISKFPDVIIIDNRMPKMTGIKATMLILKSEPGAKVILTSSDESIERKVKELGKIAFIQKPFSINELIRIIEKT